jgi:hypothetical protein
MLVAVSAAIVAGIAAAATVPDASQMVLTTTDLPHSVVSSQGASRSASLITPLAEYARTFQGVQIGQTHLIELTSTAIVGKNPAAAGNLVSDLRTAISSTAGRAAFLAETKKSFGKSLKVNSLKFVRARKLNAGDLGVEIVFAFGLKAGTLILGEEFVSVGNVLGTIDFTGTSSISPSAALSLVKAAAAHITSVLYPLPSNTVLPAVSGTAATAQTLTATPGTWLGSPTLSYQWERCNATAVCTPIPGATTTTYVVSTADIGSSLEVAVTGKNVTGSATATSAPTAVVAS